VGALCLRCEELIEANDNGLLVPHGTEEGWSEQPHHYECFLRGLVGGLNHQLGRCKCCGGTEEPDPPHLTKRQAAKAAAGYFRFPGLIMEKPR
jgi:hypothetical protein